METSDEIPHSGADAIFEGCRDMAQVGTIDPGAFCEAGFAFVPPKAAQSGKELVVKTKRTYSAAFKRQVVEELLSGTATAGQLSRRYEISAGLIGHWSNRYREGKLVEGRAANVKALEAKIRDLEQMVGRLTMDNELLKKAMGYALQKRRENSLPITGKTLEGSNGGAKC